MLAALNYKSNILDQFYLDDDGMTIRRKVDDKVKGKFHKDDVVTPYQLVGNGNDYKGIWIPGCNTTISLPWVLTVLRGVKFTDGMVIDHINGDITDNTEENLRVVTQQENCKNRKIRHDNTTGYTGISYKKSADLYIVRRTINNKRINRSHKTLEGAIKILRELDEESIQDGYTKRHCQCERSTTIENSLLDTEK